MALEYLLGSWDHLLNGQNYYMYKPKGGKWIYLSHDYDYEIGELGMTLEELYKNLPITNLLILKDQQHFNDVLKSIISKVFNPATLYPHIDEIKTLIRPYVELGKVKDAEGNYPGVLNMVSSSKIYSLEQWDAASEFTNISVMEGDVSFAIKYYILIKYREMCTTLNMECDPVYMNEKYKYPVNEELNVEPSMDGPGPFDFTDDSGDFGEETSEETEEETDIYDEPTDDPEEPTNDPEEPNDDIEKTLIIETKIKCWSELIGYPCCSSNLNTVYEKDEYGEWSYDFSKKEWCGLTLFEEETIPKDEVCWSEILGYPCCYSCKAYEVDSEGSWGVEFKRWCGIPSYCFN